jgi:hypothetical protein
MTHPKDFKKGFYLNYKDYKQIEKIIEEHNLDSDGNVDFNNIPEDEKEILWKIKTVIRNMESVRLRPAGKEQ